MNWYYAEDGQQKGPVDDAEFQLLVQSGRIIASTLVWNGSMTDWKPWAEVGQTNAAGPSATIPSSAPTPTYSSSPSFPQSGQYGTSNYGGTYQSAPAGSSMAYCSQCGQPRNADEMVEIFNQVVCPACKPHFLQRVQEGTFQYGSFEYGGFWIRFLAKILDSIIIGAIQTVLRAPLMLIGGAGDEAALILSAILGGLISLSIGIFYVVFFLGKFGATPGLMALKLKVVMPDGSPISYWRAFARFWAEQLSGCFTLFIGYIMIAFDDEKRALHDRICSTRVIKVR